MDVNFTDNSAEVKWRMEVALIRGLYAVGLTAERYAKKNTPVDTGRLRNSISHAVYNKAAYIGTNVKYAKYVEYGVIGRTGKYMLQNAAVGHSQEYRELIKKSLENA